MEKNLTIKEIKRRKSKLFAKLAIAAKEAKDSGGKPFIFHFLTTLRCNCNCESCFWKDNSVKNELTLEEIKRIYLEAKEEGFLISILWGGEPTLRKDIAEIIKFAKYEADFAFCPLVFNSSISNYFLTTQCLNEKVPKV